MFFCLDRYDQPADAFRAKVNHLQDETAAAVRETCANVGLALVDLPTGLDLPGRVDWISRRVDPLLASARR